MNVALVVSSGLLIVAVAVVAIRNVKARRTRSTLRQHSLIADRVAEYLPTALANYLVETADSSGRGTPLLERLDRILPRRGPGAELRAVLELEVRLSQLEKKVESDYVTQSGLYAGVFLAVAAALTVFAAIWLIVDAVGSSQP